jgi:NAD(P)-dependent dehydrogenase (short-subunit alcohol dehydrogenase family)
MRALGRRGKQPASQRASRWICKPVRLRARIDSMTNSTDDYLVIGASGGIGAALARRLEQEGGVTRLARRTYGFDLTDESSIAAAAAQLSARRFRAIIVATGALHRAGRRPEKSFAEIDPAEMAAMLAINAIGPALIVKHFAPLLIDKAPACLAFLSARVGSISDNRLGGWMSYRASKAALKQIVRCAAIEIARTRPLAAVLALHPGTIKTAMTKDYARGRFTASADECAEALVSHCLAATPAQSGRFYAYDGAEVAW